MSVSGSLVVPDNNTTRNLAGLTDNEAGGVFAFSNRQATDHLNNLQAELRSQGIDAHFVSRHGDHISDAALLDRALTGRRPDTGEIGPIYNSTKFNNNADMLEAFQLAEQQFMNGNFQRVGRSAGQVRVSFDRVVGRGYYANTSNFAETTDVLVKFNLNNNKPFTAFPVLPRR